MDRRGFQLPETVAEVVGWGQRMYRRTVEVDGIDRAIAIGALSFTAIFPLLIVYGALISRGNGTDIAGRLIDRLNLSGSTAESIQLAFQQPVGSNTATVIGAVLVVGTAISFTRAMQRLYESAWELPRRGFRASGWGLLWLAELVIWLFLQPVLDSVLPSGVNAAVSLALVGGLWLSTPYLLLGRRVHYRRLFPSAVLCTVAMTLAGIASVIAMPRLVASSSQEFGTIGVAFALLAWLTGLAMVIMGSAVVGAELARGSGDDGAVTGEATR